jgi:hypothetical protein
MAYDAARGVTILFGGKNWTFNALGDTWEWDGTTWTQLFPGHSPAPRAIHDMAYDPVRQRVVMFGGHLSTGGWLAETWEWDGADWLQHFPDTSPPHRYDLRLEYDPIRDRVVMFGGRDQPGDTWEWDGNEWALTNPEAERPARRAFAMAYHGGSRGIVTFGGIEDPAGTVLGDTWLLREADPSFYRTFGTGCAGTAGLAELRLISDPPRTGQQFTIEIGPVPDQAVTLGAFGWSNTSSLSGPLPLDLGIFGMAGCTLYIDVDVFVPTTVLGGSALWTIEVPNDPVWLGTEFFQQALVLEPGFQPVVSNGGLGRIGG